MPTDDARAWSAELHRRLAAALADLEHVLPDGSGTHHADCWQHHTACLAARLRRTLTGKDADHA